MFVPPKLESSLVVKYLEKAISSNQYSNFGPLVQELTSRLANYFEVDAESLVLISNATIALEAAMATSPIKKSTGPEVQSWVLPSWTFTATGLAAQRAQARFEFGDVDPKFGVLSPSGDKESRKRLSVAPFGATISHLSHADSDLIDAAASFDALRGEGRNLNQGSGVVVSLHATKSLSSGEGGVFFSRDKDWVARVKSYISFGFRPGERESQTIGTNGKMSEISAAAGLASLDVWAETRERWLGVHAEVKEISSKYSLSTVGAMPEDYISPYWVIRLENKSTRDALTCHLAGLGIATRLWWSNGLHNMPAFADVPTGNMATTNDWANTYLGLPFYPDMSAAEITKIDQALEGFKFS
jgi:dTDP-4-amino-4,6-dideoxygalactose transaminase